MQQIAKTAGLKVKFGDDPTPPDLTKTIGGGTAEEVAAAIEQATKAVAPDPEIATMKQQMSTFARQALAAKFNDFDDLADTRAVLDVASQTNVMSKDEILHYAARGAHMEEAIKAAKELGVTEYKESLQKKNVEHMPGGGGSAPPSAEESKKLLDDVIGEMSKLPA